MSDDSSGYVERVSFLDRRLIACDPGVPVRPKKIHARVDPSDAGVECQRSLRSTDVTTVGALTIGVAADLAMVDSAANLDCFCSR